MKIKKEKETFDMGEGEGGGRQDFNGSILI